MKTLFLSASSAALLFSTPALSLTPAELADKMLDVYAAAGLSMDVGKRTEDSGSVVLEDLLMTYEDGLGSIMRVEMGEMRFAPTSEQGYEVLVTHSPDFKAVNTMEIEGVSAEMTFTGTMDGRYLVKGEGDKMEYAAEYSAISMRVEEIVGDDGLENMEMTFSGADLAGTGVYDLASLEQAFDFTSSSITFAMKGSPPEGGSIDMTGGYTDVAIKGGGAIVNGSEDPEAVFKADPPLMIDMEAGSMRVNLAADGPQGGFGFSSSGGASIVKAMIGKGGLDYTLGAKDMKVNVEGDQIPVPIAFEMAEYDSRFAMPFVPGDQASPLAVRLGFKGVSVDEALWGMIDPGASLPRDPANVILDLEGTAKVTASLLDEDALMAAGGMPFEIGGLELRNLLVELAGAKLSGSGAAEMNNAGPFPMPVGGLDLQIDGVTGLVGKLTEIGLVQPEQAMPVQMMLGMFAKPGTAPDSYTSRIEMGADGSITANGIPLQ